MADDPSPGELMRGLADIRRSLDSLSAKVMTVDVWKAEREGLEYRLRETEKDISDLSAKRIADVKMHEENRKADAEKRTTDRRMVFVALIAPLLLLALQVWATSQGAVASP